MGGPALAVGLLLAPAAHAVITRLLPLGTVLGDSTYVLTARVEMFDPDKQIMLLTVDEHLKGKGLFQKLPVILKGDQEAAKGKQVPQLLKRLGPKLPLLVFINQRDSDYIAFAYTNGTWFQLTGAKPDGDGPVRWSFTHLEPYLRRTFNGSTAEMTQTIKDVLQGKKKPPPTNAQQTPGLGPEFKQEKSCRLTIHQGPPLAVIPSVLIGGPLAVLSMLFPTLFGGWKRWLAFLSVVCTTSTIYLAHFLLADRLAGSVWASGKVLWIAMTLVTVFGCVWAWLRHLRQVEAQQAVRLPGRVEQSILMVLSLVGACALAYGWRAGERLTDPAWLLVVVTCAGAWVGMLYMLAVRLRGERPRPALPSEVVMLSAMVFVSVALAGTQAGRAGTVGVVQVAEGASAALDDIEVAPGKLAWSVKLKGRGTVASRPLFAGDRVYVAVAHEDTFDPQGAVYCLESATGKELWTTRGKVKMKPVSSSSPCLANGRVFIGEGFHENYVCKLYCLDAQTGKLLWHFETGSHVESSPVVVQGRVYFGAGDDGVYCVDAQTGKELWHFPGLHCDSRLLVADGRVYVGSGVGDAVKAPAIVCLDAANGDLKWKHEQPLPVWGAPAMRGDLVYFGLSNGRINESGSPPRGEVLAVNAHSGEKVWRFVAGDGIHGQPAVDRSRVYFGSRDNHVYCLDRGTGRLCWKLDTGNPVVATVGLARSADTGAIASVYVLADGGQVFCLGPWSGKVLWSLDLARQSSADGVDLWGSPAVVVTPAPGGQSRRLYFGAALVSGGVRTPMICCVEDRVEAGRED
jgi:outer membrane protein assembly factor BamB